MIIFPFWLFFFPHYNIQDNLSENHSLTTDTNSTKGEKSNEHKESKNNGKKAKLRKRKTEKGNMEEEEKVPKKESSLKRSGRPVLKTSSTLTSKGKEGSGERKDKGTRPPRRINTNGNSPEDRSAKKSPTATSEDGGSSSMTEEGGSSRKRKNKTEDKKE